MTHISKALIKSICERVAEGYSLRAAASVSGVASITAKNWEMYGNMRRHGVEQGQYTDEESHLYVAFSDALDAARGAFEGELVGRVRGGATVDWKAALELLKRVHPEYWGGQGKLEVEVSKQAPRDELDAILDAIAGKPSG
jgi:hypothetical protein